MDSLIVSPLVFLARSRILAPLLVHLPKDRLQKKRETRLRHAGQHIGSAGGDRREPGAGAAPPLGLPADHLLRRDAGADDGPRAPLPLRAGRRAGQRRQEHQPHLPGHHHLQQGTNAHARAVGHFVFDADPKPTTPIPSPSSNRNSPLIRGDVLSEYVQRVRHSAPPPGAQLDGGRRWRRRRGGGVLAAEGARHGHEQAVEGDDAHEEGHDQGGKFTCAGNAQLMTFK